jgi:amicyanin
MSKTVVGVIVSVLAIIIIGAVVLRGNSDGNPTTTSDHSSMDMSGSNQQSSLGTSSTSTKPSDNSQATQANSVEIKDYAYVPGKIQIKKGTTVTWTNRDSVRHDVSPDKSGADFKGSDLLAQGESYTFTFNTIGTYTYHCSPHPYMKGTVEVTE